MVVVLCSMAIVGALKGWTIGVWTCLGAATVVALFQEWSS